MPIFPAYGYSAIDALLHTPSSKKQQLRVKVQSFLQLELRRIEVKENEWRATHVQMWFKYRLKRLAKSIKTVTI